MAAQGLGNCSKVLISILLMRFSKILAVCLTASLAGVALFTLGWLYIGVDEHSGDHEVGNTYELFIKSEPGFQVVYSDPAEDHLEIRPYEALSPERQKALDFYCKVRFGTVDRGQCYQEIYRKFG